MEKNLILFISFFLIKNIGAIQDQLDQFNIINNITKDYRKDVRPSFNLLLNLRISLRQLVSINEKDQIMTSNIYLAADWIDLRLAWKREDFNDLGKILIPVVDLWTPDLFVINTADKSGFIQASKSNLAIVTSKGHVYVLINLSSLKTRCKLNVFNFPFDKQKCPIIIGSWQHDRQRIDFVSTNDKVNLTNFQINPVWDLKDVSVSSITANSRFLNEEMVDMENDDIVFELILERKPLYYITNNIYPCLVLNCVTFLAFYMPFAIQMTISISFLCFLYFFRIKIYLILFFRHDQLIDGSRLFFKSFG